MRTSGWVPFVLLSFACARVHSDANDVDRGGAAGRNQGGRDAGGRDAGGRAGEVGSLAEAGAGGSAGKEGVAGGIATAGVAGTLAVAGAAGKGGEAGTPGWTGLLDPGFQELPPNAWTLSNGAVIQPKQATGAVDPGRIWLPMYPDYDAATGHIGTTSNCTGAIFARQQFDAAPFSVRGPTAVELSAGSGVGGTIGSLLVRGRPVLSFDGREAYATRRTCLGEGAYGPGAEFSLWARTLGTCWEINGSFVDHVGIVSDATCPAPGEVPNGDFEGTGGWTAASSGPGGIAEIAAGLGSQGSHAAHLARTVAQQVSLHGTISVPLGSSRPHAALQFKVRGTAGATVNLSLGGTWHVLGTGAFETHRVCLPDSVSGLVADLGLSIDDGTDARDFVIDDLAVVDDPGCSSPSFIDDPGFERQDGVSSWMLVSSAASSSAHIESNPALAHSGSGYLHLVGTACLGDQDQLSASTTFSLPPAPVDGLFAYELHFFYRRPAATGMDYLLGSVSLPETDVWTEETGCSYFPSFVENLTLYLRSGSACSASFAPDDLYVDDVSVSRVASCPVQ
ncbi:MAG TPA: hypothetical protein VER12_09680 [Polyangiaceae bacterium]|nr:hypothetical protein [Polyangiaceae bacterium]